MPKLLTSATAALILLAGAATAHAQQTPSIATLPPQAPQGATASEASGAVPSPKYVGPAAGAPESATFGASAGLAGSPSPKYAGPAPGGPEGANYGASEKPAGYESSAAMRPYTTTGMGPKAN